MLALRSLGEEVEVRAGIEPAHRGFADRSVTTSPSHLVSKKLLNST